MINSMKTLNSVGSKQRVKIFAVDPSTRTIHAVLMQSGAGINVAVWETGNLFIWPKEGEIWTVYKGSNGIWMLDKPVETVDTVFPVDGMEPGQAKIASDKIFDKNGQAVVSTDESVLVNNDMLVWDGTNKVWIPRSTAPPQARIFNNANQSIPNNTATTLTFNTTHYDFQTTSPQFVIGQPTRLTVQSTGLYAIGCNVEFAANATGIRQVELFVQGSTIIASDKRNACSAGTTRISLNTHYRMFSTTFVEVRVLQDSGGALNVNFTNQYSPEFWWFRVSP